ncbi:2,3-epoxybenzoyl-CoA dihydrolase [Oceanibacterium hippocampi]|uniref:Benzoyl-CoA-dihydrodiol lyase n=1 Tax=Oceanibacterium hippocampi TaxID=745714 RepID=A0A1Y5SCI7_9PROT|nr:2,3-epoxybenzoyl-CoA dihydrolase [Oceanibacterium hippocampi]SLN37679.1 Benzoyl-CoA-dihydrodiol lyase [Oceanibacterium hippocampi]
MIDFQTAPDRYRHWKLAFDGPVATLTMDVSEDGGLRDDYELKLNSYDLGVDIELYDAVQRLRFEHPEVRTVVITSGKEKVFCAGANIRMLAGSSHGHKVNFCKFTNETRLSIEDACENSGQHYMAAINGACAGGGYELALTADHLVLIDDGSSTVSLPELPLLAVLPGTGGLTRLTDKRHVRRDRADVFCTLEEGVRGKRAIEWRLVDETVPRSRWEETVTARAREIAERSDRPADAKGIALTPLTRTIDGDEIRYETVTCAIDRATRSAAITIHGPTADVPATAPAIHAAGAAFWPLQFAREFDDLMLHLRLNEDEIGTWLLRAEGDPARVEAADAALAGNAGDWLVREISLFLKRTLKRLDLSSRSLFAMIEPGSCFVGTLLELALAADRSYMLDGQFEGDNRPPATIRLTAANFGPYPMSNGLTRLAARSLHDTAAVEGLKDKIGRDIEAAEAEELGLVTFAPDDIDWDDEIRLAVEERSAFSPDALTGMEASLRFGGPETMETKIFGRLTAWQNWIFQRPNAVGENGALRLYGTGRRSDYDKRRV